jgi:hypothetical protein
MKKKTFLVHVHWPENDPEIFMIKAKSEKSACEKFKEKYKCGWSFFICRGEAKDL